MNVCGINPVPFNSQSYYRNKARRQAMGYLADARRAKLADNVEHVKSRVRLARNSWRTYLSYLKLDEMDADMEMCRSGNMAYSEFIEKWKAD